jgi:hypothetical protein
LKNKRIFEVLWTVDGVTILHFKVDKMNILLKWEIPNLENPGNRWKNPDFLIPDHTKNLPYD